MLKKGSKAAKEKMAKLRSMQKGSKSMPKKGMKDNEKGRGDRKEDKRYGGKKKAERKGK